ncbi:efflux RND transporter periplasmic adaptor subunit [Rubinisphaera margarita]|uniref:efflux RND transporter periplasmic adaptor subunit n=1 Tax=Rubinisphaera margarita TaxID=2909586 RepID=UPI001EE94623|nr:efflux RND transporter periplasmic adaptor subunit [Rubinisphaera margarita]MCG6154581.1 efflux RND transporter periplasmic adaptor subunit [Rubinisphaera margarita]
MLFLSKRLRSALFVTLCTLGLFCANAPDLHAQRPDPNAQPAATQLIIKREAIHPISPDKFRVPISLAPTRQLDIRSLNEGIVQNIRVQPGGKVSGQEEVLRIESAKAIKQLDRAKANLKVATIRRDLARGQTGPQAQANLDLAEAELDVAEADLDLAQLNHDNTSIRAPFAGEILNIAVTVGTFVNEGDLLMVLRDSTELSARIPVDRQKVKQGDTLEVQLDNGVAKGTVQTVLPLTNEWQSLRQLIDTAAIAVVVIDNKDRRFEDGQTVYSSIVPRQSVIEIPNTALKNSETGTRLVQVLRDNLVRDIEVELLGAIGDSRSYVAGPFQSDDELITESSQVLLDSTVVMPATQANTQTAPATPSNTPQRRTFNPDL